MRKYKLGLLLLIIGVALLLGSGISYTTHEKTKVGPISVEHPEKHRIPYMPVAGVILSVAGGAMMLAGRAKSN